jgi:hypothetical protein
VGVVGRPAALGRQGAASRARAGRARGPLARRPDAGLSPRRSTRSSSCTRGSGTGCSSRSRRCGRSRRRSSTTTSATTAAGTRRAFAASSSAAPGRSSTPRSCGSSSTRCARRRRTGPTRSPPHGTTPSCSLLHEAAAAEAERARLQGDSFVIVRASLDSVPDVNVADGYAAGDALSRRGRRRRDRAGANGARRRSGRAPGVSGDPVHHRPARSGRRP